MKHTDLGGPGCPYCGHPNDIATDVLGGKTPQDGDYAFCGACAEVGIFERSALGVITVRAATADETFTIKNGREYIDWVRALRATRREMGE